MGEDKKRNEDNTEIFVTKSACGVTWWAVSFEERAGLEFIVQPGHVYLAKFITKGRVQFND